MAIKKVINMKNLNAVNIQYKRVVKKGWVVKLVLS